MFSFVNFKRSFGYATRGLWQVFKEEQSFRLQLIAAAVVIFLAFYFSVSVWEWIVLILVISSVLILELINSIFERLVDIVKPGVHEYVKSIKDIMAGAVFLASLAAFTIGILIFYPHVAA